MSIADTNRPAATATAPARGLTIQPYFCPPDCNPYARIGWRTVTAQIKGDDGRLIFEQPSVEVPEDWSDRAANIVASKYFYGDLSKGFDPTQGGREHSVSQLIGRVCNTIAHWGKVDGYFATAADAVQYREELAALCLGQYGAFNSPVWFNVGLSQEYHLKGAANNWRWHKGEGRAVPCLDAYEYPQGSACFIQSVADDMGSIMDLARSEAMLFKYGSGTGTDLSTLRSTKEKLQGGGKPSGPVSFMRVYDAIAGVVKSGGKCLAPDQPILTDRGVKPVGDLADLEGGFVVLSYSRRLGRVAAKRAHAWCSGVKPVISVITDKGEFRVSHDHPMMLKDGIWKRAADLKPGMSLMQVSTDRHKDGYVRVGLQDGMKGKALFHQLVAKDILRWDLQGKIVHHENKDKGDNRPENLRLKTQAEHAADHGRGRAFYTDGHPGERNGMHASSAFWSDSERSSEYRLKQSAVLKRRNPAMLQKAAVRKRMLNLGYSLINAGHDLSTFAGYVLARKAEGRRCPDVARQALKFENVFGSYEAFYRELRENNHEVIEVRPIGLSRVYSVEVEDPEPDDKRIWSEHNYVLAPFGSTEPFINGVACLNTRRAAKMQTLKCFHPDINEFIECKLKEDRKARALIAQGYDASFNGEAYGSVAFQNANLSVRVTDEFMEIAEHNRGLEPLGSGRPNFRNYYELRSVTTGEGIELHDPDVLMERIARGTWECGDPGLQYEDTIQRWHTCPNTAPINSSNPCCFVFETLIGTSEGRIPIGMLAARSGRGEDLPLAFSFDFKAGVPVLRQIVRAWKAGETTKLVEVETDKGLVFRCTPEHRFYLRSGDAVEAKDLKPGQRLRKIGRGEIGRHPRTTIETREGTFYQSRWMCEQANGPIPDGFEVHHANEDRRDDRLSNFELIEAGEHKSRHSRGIANAMAIEAEDSLMVETWEAIEALPRQTHKDGPAVTVARWNKFIRDHGLKGRVPLARGDGRIRGMGWVEFAAWVESSRSLVNDVVLAVREFENETPVAVYDIEVEDTHNFEVSSGAAPHGIIVSNSEYMFIDDSACNLASINLMKFRREDGMFDVEGFRAAVRIFLIAQEILVDRASYPTRKIAENSHEFRPLGLGFANVGALLMANGLPYDSDEGRALAGAITAIMHGQAYLTSSDVAAVKGAFGGFAANRDPMLRVIDQHADAARGLLDNKAPANSEARWLATEAVHLWDVVRDVGVLHGFRNSQVTVLAPTGTIAFLMDCDTTGVEPETALVKYKTLAGGGMLKIVNRIVPLALQTLGYSEDQIAGIIRHIDEYDTIEDVAIGETVIPSGLKAEHLAVFDCSFPPSDQERDGYPVQPVGKRSISWLGHVRMMEACQPFLSGAISKTVNLPEDSTPDEIREAYVEGWKRGLKALAIYRDNSKASQPLSTKAAPAAAEVTPAFLAAADIETEVGLGQPARLDAHSNEIPDPWLINGSLVDPDWPVMRGLDGPVIGSLRELSELANLANQPKRERLPSTRRSMTHKFEVDGHEGYITVGMYQDGRPGEVFVKMSKEGSTIGGLMDALGIAVSVGLQYGVPLPVLVEKFAYTRFEPSGMTQNRDIPIARSVADYVFRWLGMEFLAGYHAEHAPHRDELAAEAMAPIPAEAATGGEDLEIGDSLEQLHQTLQRTISQFHEIAIVSGSEANPQRPRIESHNPSCRSCGGPTQRTGACYTCTVCGEAGGCG